MEFVPFEVGMLVFKKNGYPFQGTVQSVFQNRAGQTRIVVELERGFDGDMLHIFSPNQLEEDLVIASDEHRLEALKLPTRVHNLLVDAGYDTVEKLLKADHWELDRIKGFGFTAGQITTACLQDWQSK